MKGRKRRGGRGGRGGGGRGGAGIKKIGLSGCFRLFGAECRCH